MTRINLLPPEVKERARRPNILPWLIIPVLLIVAGTIGGYLYFNSQKQGRQDDLAQLEQERSQLRAQNAPLTEFERQQQQLSALEGLLEQANRGRVAWARMLNDLAQFVPEGLRTASDPTAPAIWLTELTIDATPLQDGAPALQGNQPPVVIKGRAAPAWLCIQTWLPRASDFRAKGFLDLYPYYYYFRGQPKVAEFLVRLQNMEEWSNIWIVDSHEEQVTNVTTTFDSTTQTLTEISQPTWALVFEINAFWNTANAVYQAEPAAEGGAAQ
ncbi:MAG: PilN domain-containing protein [Candidatus Geothermincolia bacterium]